MQASRYVLVPNLQFRSKSIIAYNSFELSGLFSSQTKSSGSYHFEFTTSQIENQQKLKLRERYTGQITAGAKKRLTKAISLLVQSSSSKKVFNPVRQIYHQHRLSFVTLTLPDIEACKDARFTHTELLQPLLRILRNKYGMISYVWKCELTKKGIIHYHLTTDLFINLENLKNVWNGILNRNNLLVEFKSKYGHNNPNSIDIKSVKKVQDLEAYLVKYISKSYQNEKSLKAKVWDCSMNLKRAKYFTTINDSINDKILNQLAEQGYCSTYSAENFTIFKFKHEGYTAFFPQNVKTSYNQHMIAIKDRFSDLFSKVDKEKKKEIAEIIKTVLRPKYIQLGLDLKTLPPPYGRNTGLSPAAASLTPPPYGRNTGLSPSSVYALK